MCRVTKKQKNKIEKDIKTLKFALIYMYFHIKVLYNDKNISI